MATKDEEIAMIGTAAGSISVMAPSDMPGGYEFFADAGNGSSYKVRVVRTEANERKIPFDMFNAWLDTCRMPGCLVAVLGILIIASFDEILAVDGLLPRPQSPSSFGMSGRRRRFPVRPSEEENLVARLKIEVWRTKKRTTPNQ
jgi:hypothetical protein